MASEKKPPPACEHNLEDVSDDADTGGSTSPGSLFLGVESPNSEPKDMSVT